MFHVIPHSTLCNSPNLNVKRGYLSHLNPHHVEIFLSILDLSYVAALKFDCRPGLKFLVQKVVNLEQPANLYRQAAAAWTIKIITLLELCLREIEELNATLELVKTILGTGLSDRECVYDIKHRKLTKYLRQLRMIFDELCETYVEVVLDEDGRYTKVDSFAERKIFLLVAQPDDYPEITRKEVIDDRLAASTPAPVGSLEKEVPDVQPNDQEDDQDDPDDVYNPNLDDESGLEELGVECENDPRPFRLSDLAAEYSTDSGPQSEPETDDSRPMSRLGSVTEKVVYLDRSGTSSEDYIDAKYDAVTPAPPNMMYDSGDLCCNLETFWKTESTDASSMTTMTNVKMLHRDRAPSDEIFLYQKSYPKRRGSDVCLLSRRKSLTFITMADLENANKSSLVVESMDRSKSAMELRETRHPIWTTCSETRELETNQSIEEEDKSNTKSSQILENIDELLRDYERSKRGFRTNPFLRDEGDKEISAAESQPGIINQEVELQRRNVNKDSEAHRKAWADILSTALEWALALPVSYIHYITFLHRVIKDSNINLEIVDKHSSLSE